MDTTRNTTVWWWIAGIVALILVLWLAFRASGPNAGIPNTGVDDATSSQSTLDNSGLNNYASTTMDVKG